eukprot:Skav225462  [mRNA]  locus=scaffold881:163319:163603:+ [translate_table: standard]
MVHELSDILGLENLYEQQMAPTCQHVSAIQTGPGNTRDMLAVPLQITKAKQTVPYFGERALLYQEPRAATVKVLSEAHGTSGTRSIARVVHRSS